MTEPRKCPECGTPLRPDVLEGACPMCALLSARHTDGAGGKVHYFGDYELADEIARGGMGVVYRAKQLSLNRIVALKMILAGRLASETEVKRFRHEAGAAANLQHPNIVAVYEVGEHEGQYYYSMEFIEGKNLAVLVRDQPLSAMQAAQYIRTVAEAVHFAHQHGTLHRDLKPTNILIDIFNQPRITDFGLARSEQSDPHLTATGQIIGTPAFMSPEQAEGKAGAVGPRSDVYSTGAVLYYLLTQRPPFTAESLTDLLAQVKDREPVSPRVLNPNVPRDLETICFKCLEKDPARRYQSAQELADELGRFGRGEPIMARPLNPVEKTWRWCRRNPALSRSLALAALFLVCGIVVSTWQMVRATRAEQKARTTGRLAQTVATLLANVLDGVDPSIALSKDTKKLRENLNKTAENLGKELSDQPEVEADLSSKFSVVYQRLGEYEKAAAMRRRVLDLRRKLYGNNDPRVADSLNDLGNMLYRQSRLKEAEEKHRAALVLREKLFGSHSRQVAASLNNLGNTLREQGKTEEAETMFRKALALRRELLGNEHEETGDSLDSLGGILSLQEKFAEAEPMQREALALTKRLQGNESPDVAYSMNNLADTLAAEGKLDEAEVMVRDTLAMRRKLLGNEHPDVAFSLFNLANVLMKENKFVEAESFHRQALAMRRKLLGNDHLDVAGSLNNLAALLINENKLDEAETMQREALTIQRKALGAEHQDIAGSLANLADILRRRGNLPDAEISQREALAMQQKLLGDDHSDVAAALAGLAEVLYDEGKFADAETSQRDELAMRRKWFAQTSPPLPVTVNNLMDNFCRLTHTLLREEKFDEAEPLAREWLALGEKESPDDWQTFNARSLLGGSLLGQKKFTEAEPLLLSGQEGMNQRLDKTPPEYKFRAKESLESLVRLYETTSRPDQAAEWQTKLTNYNKTEAEQKAGTPKP